ncbi:Protein DENND6B [Smittium culicis]|uniref:Protein DENND6B n=1 Tax=Smittium culicis TaxID=133412 RepID=A0A1R1YNP0_9FUNG|nr:Protein DENND6B [Smittium culicis]
MSQYNPEESPNSVKTLKKGFVTPNDLIHPSKNITLSSFNAANSYTFQKPKAHTPINLAQKVSKINDNLNSVNSLAPRNPGDFGDKNPRIPNIKPEPRLPTAFIKNEDIEFEVKNSPYITPLDFSSSSPELNKTSSKTNQDNTRSNNSIFSHNFDSEKSYPTCNDSYNIPSQNDPKPNKSSYLPFDDVSKRANRVLALLASDKSSNKKLVNMRYRDMNLSNDNITNLDNSSKPLNSDRPESNLAQNSTNISQYFDFLNNKETLKRINQWIISIALVKFDENSGPLILSTYPQTSFSPNEQKAIRFSSLPDSTTTDSCDSTYSFRLSPHSRRGGMQESVVILTHLNYHGFFMHLAQLLGPSYFDYGIATIETSLKNISEWPSPTCSHLSVQFLGNILQIDFPVSNNSQFIETSSFNSEKFSPNRHILASVISDCLIRNFKSCLCDLYICWELMILAETIVVFADSPSRCFEVVYGLVDIIKPITYCGDYRPYFTLQDPDFHSLISPKKVPNNTIIGVSNPFFKQATAHWPNTLILNSASRIQKIKSVDRPLILANFPFKPKSRNVSSHANSNSSKLRDSPNLLGISNPANKNQFGLTTKHKQLTAVDEDFLNEIESGLDGVCSTGPQPPWVLSNSLRLHFSNLTDQFLAPLNRYFATLIPSLPKNFVNITHVKGALISVLTTTPPQLCQWKNVDFFASLLQHGLPSGLVGKQTTVSKASAAASAFAAAIFKPSFEKSASFNSKSNSNQILFNPSNPQSSQNFENSSQKSSSISSSVLPTISNEWKDFYTKFLNCGNFISWLQKRTNDSKYEIWKQFFTLVADSDINGLIDDNTPVIFSNKPNELSKTIGLIDHSNCRNDIESRLLKSEMINSTMNSTFSKMEISDSYANQSLSDTNNADDQYLSLNYNQKPKESYGFTTVAISVTVSADPQPFRSNPRISISGKKNSTSVEPDQKDMVFYQAKNEAYNIGLSKSNQSSAHSTPVLVRTNSQSSFFPTTNDKLGDSKIAVLGSSGNLVGYINSNPATPSSNQSTNFESPEPRSRSKASTPKNSKELSYDHSLENSLGISNLKKKKDSFRRSAIYKNSGIVANMYDCKIAAESEKAESIEKNKALYMQNKSNRSFKPVSSKSETLEEGKGTKVFSEKTGNMSRTDPLKCKRTVAELVELADYFASLLQIEINCDCLRRRSAEDNKPRRDFDDIASSSVSSNGSRTRKYANSFSFSNDDRHEAFKRSSLVSSANLPYKSSKLGITYNHRTNKKASTEATVLDYMTKKTREKIYDHLVTIVSHLPKNVKKRYSI